MKLIDETVQEGARKHKACEILGITLRTLQRWRHQPVENPPTDPVSVLFGE